MQTALTSGKPPLMLAGFHRGAATHEMHILNLNNTGGNTPSPGSGIFLQK